jgi:uncharacterized membrane protein
VELHEGLLFFHILGSIIWVGGVIVQNAVMARASRAPDRTAVHRLAAELEWVGPWLIGPSSLVVIGLGIWLVLLEEWQPSPSCGSGCRSSSWPSQRLRASSPGLSKRISRLADERGAEDGEVRDRLSRLLWLARIDMLILVVVLWLMVFKPGA